ncbi:MAG: peptidyl-prolyl cis-trans isomerase [Myxococcota bacterium]
MKASTVHTVLLLLVLVGCSSEEQEQREAQRERIEVVLNTPGQPAQVVATVNGKPISAAVLREMAQIRTKATREELLNELIAAELLYQQALDRGYGDDAALANLHRQLMVERMFAERVEQTITEDDVPDKEVEQLYKQREGLYHNAPTRIVDHILIQPSSKRWNIREEADTIPEEVYAKANAVAQRLRSKLGDANADDFDRKAIEALKDTIVEDLPEDLEVRAEFKLNTPAYEVGIPGTPGHRSGMVKPFTQRAFETPVGTISQPVRTMFGVHVLWVRREKPKSLKTLPDMADELRQELLVRKQSLVAGELLKEASHRVEVKAGYENLSLLQPVEEEASGEQPGPQ